MEFLFFWFGHAAVVGVVASHRGRSGFGWFLLSLVSSPLLAGLFVLAPTNLRKASEAELKARYEELLLAFGGSPATHPKPNATFAD